MFDIVKAVRSKALDTLNNGDPKVARKVMKVGKELLVWQAEIQDSGELDVVDEDPEEMTWAEHLEVQRKIRAGEDRSIYHGTYTLEEEAQLEQERILFEAKRKRRIAARRKLAGQ